VDIVRDAFDNKPLLWVQGKKFLVNPLTDQIPATSPDLLRAAAKEILRAARWRSADTIVGEEDRGGSAFRDGSLAAIRHTRPVVGRF
jgi:phosphoribosylanthranilate isomerase